MLGLPDDVRGCLFDLDGVVTDTSKIHAAAWKTMLDTFLARRAAATGAVSAPFDPVDDYERYVNGKPRLDGVRDFLASRGITLPEGSDDDLAGADTVRALGNHKNRLVQRLLRQRGVDTYEGSIRYLEAVRAAGLRSAVVSSSANATEVIAIAGIAHLFDLVVDGAVVERLGLRGKPQPDAYLEGARRLDVTPSQAAVFEDAVAGVESGRAGAFRAVVGVDRTGQADALRAHGADLVVDDLAELLNPDPR